MKVKTIRMHINPHLPTPVKQNGRKYEVSDIEGQNLIADGLVVEDTPATDEG